jgi:glutaminyl-peptide cyclotransferase
VRVRKVVVHRRLPHAREIFTQGLTFAYGTLWESAGLYGRSGLRELRLPEGAEHWTGPLPDHLFGEGIVRAPTGIWQLTWREGVALRWDTGTRRISAEVPYDREGWGACLCPEGVVTSDGSDELVIRDPARLTPQRTVAVRLDGRPVTGLNDLEWSAGRVWATVFGADRYLGVDLADGTVTDTVDATELRRMDATRGADVLNGIAAADGFFYVTGKRWSTLFEVTFEPVPPGRP